MLPEELISITETDLWNFQQISLTADTDSALNSNSFPLQIQTSASKRISSVINSATTVTSFLKEVECEARREKARSLGRPQFGARQRGRTLEKGFLSLHPERPFTGDSKQILPN